MKYYVFYNVLFVFLWSCGPVSAQLTPFAVIRDADGFSNVRLGDKKTIAGRIYDNQVFAVRGFEDGNEWQDWVWIDCPDYGMQVKTFEKFINKTKEGVLHRSRIQSVYELPQWEKEVRPTDSVIICKSRDIKIEIRYGLFIPGDHIITKNKEGVVIKIDDKEPWGIDGQIYDHLIEIKSITLIGKSTVYSFPKESIQNLLQPNLNPVNFGLAVGSDHHLCLYMSNSDGAGSYDVIWTIRNGKVYNQFLYRNF